MEKYSLNKFLNIGVKFGGHEGVTYSRPTPLVNFI